MGKAETKEPHARRRRVLDVLEELPPTEEETRETLAVLGIDPAELTARLLAEADKAEARARGGAGGTTANVAGAPAPKKKEAPRWRLAAVLAAAAAMACAAGVAVVGLGLWPSEPPSCGALHVKLPTGAEPYPDAGAPADAGTPAPRHAPRHRRPPR